MTILRLAQPKLACLHAWNNLPPCEIAAFLLWHVESFLSLACNACCCDRTLSTHMTSWTSPPSSRFTGHH